MSPPQKLLTKVLSGDLKLKNRVIMASLTRGRCPGTVPDDLVAKYYADRATAGLILSEGVLISPLGMLLFQFSFKNMSQKK
jgi:N-ethylmaleimide reductase